MPVKDEPVASRVSGVAAGVVRALATELVDHILGFEKRALEQAQAGGEIVNPIVLKNELVDEVALKIMAIMPPLRSSRSVEAGALKRDARDL
jgi:hypothetical protein